MHSLYRVFLAADRSRELPAEKTAMVKTGSREQAVIRRYIEDMGERILSGEVEDGGVSLSNLYAEATRAAWLEAKRDQCKCHELFASVRGCTEIYKRSCITHRIFCCCVSYFVSSADCHTHFVRSSNCSGCEEKVHFSFLTCPTVGYSLVCPPPPALYHKTLVKKFSRMCFKWSCCLQDRAYECT